MIHSDTLYTAEDLRELGIGSVELMEARKSGLVIPREMSRAFWYLGSELICWSETRRVAGKGKQLEPVGSHQ